MKLKNLLILLSILMTSIILGFASLAYVSLGDLGGALKTNSTNATKYAKLLNDTRAAQVAFQIQVQEWKNILVRGNDKELYDKHLKGFESQEAAMQANLAMVKTAMQTLKIETLAVDNLVAAHKELGEKYRTALLTWNPEDENTGKAVDKLLRGIDRQTSSGLTELSGLIEKTATEDLAKTNDKAQAKADEALQAFGIISLVSLVSAILVSIGIGRSVLRKVGGEPADLAMSFRKIAQGDLTQSIAIKEGDETSLAASAALMQMRVRAMVRSIHNGAAELGTAADKAQLSSSMEVVKESMREARQAVKGLSDAADRFKA